jgi:hypothetical protein
MSPTAWTPRYYGSLDFRFENDTDYPDKRRQSYKSSGSTYLTVTIYGNQDRRPPCKMTNKVTTGESETSIR